MGEYAHLAVVHPRDAVRAGANPERAFMIAEKDSDGPRGRQDPNRFTGAGFLPDVANATGKDDGDAGNAGGRRQQNTRRHNWLGRIARRRTGGPSPQSGAGADPDVAGTVFSQGTPHLAKLRSLRKT